MIGVVALCCFVFIFIAAHTHRQGKLEIESNMI